MYAPVRDVTITGTYSKAVRAPNIGELFSGESQTFQFITDPCNFNQVQNGSPNRAANCAALLAALGADPTDYSDIRSTNISGLLGSNPDLSEEAAKTWTIGAILQPRFIPGLTARVDWYNIKLKNAINTASPEELAELCVDQPTLDNPYCPLIVRQNGDDGDAQPGNIIDFTQRPFNVASFETSGLDLNLNYRLRTARAGNFSLNVVGNYLRKLQFIGVPGGPLDDDRGEAFAPKYTVNSDLSWNMGRITLNYGLQWFSKTVRGGFSNQDLETNPDILADKYKFSKARWQHDIFGSVETGREGRNLELFAGVTNLFNQKPEIGTDTYPVSSIGRYFFGGARVKLGKIF
jgi:iron complex outermembrane receptor protein